MKYTLAECVARINQSLNYPSVNYEDIYHYFDQAIAELNTLQHISLPSIKELVDANRINPDTAHNLVLRNPDYESSGTVISSTKDNIDAYFNVRTNLGYRYCTDDRKFYVRNIRNTDVKTYEFLYGYSSGTEYTPESYYITLVIGNTALWKTFVQRSDDIDLTTILPSDWITLFLIPYVCFKYAVRNGDTGNPFNTEFTQGYQQLSNCYSVPSKVILRTVAHLPVYREDTEKHLSNLNIQIPTKAITEDMKIGSHVSALYGNEIFETRGWGLD